jgi:hypothetical protein
MHHLGLHAYDSREPQARHGFRVRFDLALHRRASWALCMGLMVIRFSIHRDRCLVCSHQLRNQDTLDRIGGAMSIVPRQTATAAAVIVSVFFG